MPASSSRPLYSDRDRQRGYVINKKLVALAYLTEVIIALASLVGAAIFARIYGHADRWLMAMMMLAPIGYAMVEVSRVPLALAVRTQASVLLRLAAVVGVLCAAGVTVKSMSQLGEIMFRPRLVDVMHARQHLDDAQTRAADLEQKITEADRLIAQRDAQVQNAEHLLALATDKLGGLPGQKCLPISGTTRDGRSYRGMRCATDPRVAALTANLGTARANRDGALALLAAARRGRALFDRTSTQQQLIEAQSAYHEAVLNSQLHSFTAMMFGKEPSEVSDGEIHRFLRIFVFLPAICTALAATLVAMSAVTKLKPRPEQTVQLDERAGEYILGPLAQQILREATDRTVSALHASVAPPPPRPTRAPFIVPERSVS